VGLFDKVGAQRLADYERQQLLLAAFEHRELRVGRAKHYDNERREHRMLRRIDSHWGFEPKWVDAGSFDQDAWDRRFQEWQANARNDEHFDEDLRAGQQTLATAQQKMAAKRLLASLRGSLHMF